MYRNSNLFFSKEMANLSPIWAASPRFTVLQPDSVCVYTHALLFMGGHEISYCVAAAALLNRLKERGLGERFYLGFGRGYPVRDLGLLFPC